MKDQIFRNKKILVTGVCVLLVFSVVIHVYNRPTPEQLTKRLEQLFAYIESNVVKAFRNQDWCKVFEYKGGVYSSNTMGTCTYSLSTEDFQPFDLKSQADFDNFAQKMEEVGTSIIIMTVKFNPSGKIEHAKFSEDSIFPKAYVYEPHYKNSPTQIVGENRYEKINSDWYIAIEDLN